MQYDPSPYVRSLALQGIGDNPKLDRLTRQSLAQAALNDPNRGVQEQAQDILSELTETPRSSKRDMLMARP
jgi:hypothetical protein